MPDLRELQQKLESVSALREIVGAMRNLAAIYVRRAESTLDAIRPYSDATQTALRVVLERLCGEAAAPPGDDDRVMAVVFTGDQGLCGVFNERVVRRFAEYRDGRPGPVDAVSVGHRGYGLLRLRGTEPVLGLRAPTSIEGIKAKVADLALEIFAAYTESGAAALVFVYNTYGSMGSFTENVRTVVPPSLAAPDPESAPYRFRGEPILSGPPEEILGPLVEEYFFIELYRALLESHAGENGARLMAMTAASANIDDRLVDLTRETRTVRQDAITSELLDVVGGAEALGRGF